MNYYKDNFKNKRVYVIGHLNPDVDSIISTILLDHLLKWLGIDAKGVKLMPCDEITKKVTKEIKCPEVPLIKLEELKNQNVFLVDHTYKVNSLGEHFPANIVGIIGHNTRNGTEAAPFIRNENVGCAARIVLDLMEKEKYPVSDEEYLWTLYALGVDSCCLLKTNTTKEDIELANKWEKKLGISHQFLKEKLYLNAILMINEKYHGFSSYVEILHVNDQKMKKIEEIQNYIRNHNGIDLWVFFVYNYEDATTTVCYSGPLAKHFSTTTHDSIISRGATVIPEIRKKIANLIESKQI
ncbi:manganese-dependent inorganic pyrophosphatase-related [Anaeramoeba ignava]|uniref:Manganese-dependent inorganic pyrophosphatase-related n=1 Tax=Anaeramoeba ignava TaxID=1746090 RepID=A0A9Q0RD24_ANAIG|nr:manganese-dependent inorganic pyrophosphatase-related [Anaeramoeba ignava]